MAEIRPVKNSLIDEDRPNVNEKVPIQRMPFCNCAAPRMRAFHAVGYPFVCYLKKYKTFCERLD